MIGPSEEYKSPLFISKVFEIDATKGERSCDEELFPRWLQTCSGNGIVLIENDRIPLAEGQGVLIPTFQSFTLIAEEPWNICLVTFEGDLADEIIRTLGFRGHFKAEASNAFSLDEWLQRKQDRKAEDQFKASAEAFEVLLMIRAQQTSREEADPLFTTYVAPVMTMIETRYGEALSVEKLAEVVAVSPQYMTKLFHRFVGTTPYRYLLEVRIDRAKRVLVLQPELSIRQIADHVGFKHLSNFITLFGKSTGMSPLQFRKKYNSPI